MDQMAFLWQTQHSEPSEHGREVWGRTGKLLTAPYHDSFPMPVSGMFIRIPTPSGKSSNCVCKISRTWKVLENEFGPGKSWNLLGNDADADTKICASTHLCSLFEQFLCCFFTACDSDEHILQYGCRYHTIYVVSNCSLSVYLNIAGLRQGPGKMLPGSWKSHGIFCNQESGNPGLCKCIARWTSYRAARRYAPCRSWWI